MNTAYLKAFHSYQDDLLWNRDIDSIDKRIEMWLSSDECKAFSAPRVFSLPSDALRADAEILQTERVRTLESMSIAGKRARTAEEQRVSSEACRILRERFIGSSPLHIDTYDDDYIIRNFFFEWSLIKYDFRFRKMPQ